jgi:hypothetical protein
MNEKMNNFKRKYENYEYDEKTNHYCGAMAQFNEFNLESDRNLLNSDEDHSN